MCGVYKADNEQVNYLDHVYNGLSELEVGAYNTCYNNDLHFIRDVRDQHLKRELKCA